MAAFTLEFGELIDEAFERAGVEPSSIVARHLISARRSMGLLLTEIEAAGCPAEYRMLTTTLPLTVGQAYVTLPADTIDILDAVLRTTTSGVNSDIPLTRSSRQEWLQTSDKAAAGTPAVFWVSKSTPSDIAPSTNENVAVLWPVPNVAGSYIVFTRLRGTIVPTLLDDAVDARRNWLEIMCAGLAAKVAQKFSPDRYSGLNAEYQTKLLSRLNSENEGDVNIGYRAHGWSRRRRH